MTAALSQNSYGKSGIRLTKVWRLPDRHELVEMTVDIRLTGAFEQSYLSGDNSSVIATDSMKNTVYLLAKDHPVDSPEAFAIHLANHFVQTYRQVATASVNVEQSAWLRIDVNGEPHPTAFYSGGGGGAIRFALAIAKRSENAVEVHGGFCDLLVLKTTDSAFASFVRDKFTTLPEVSDRILATKVTAKWTYSSPNIDYNRAFDRIMRAMLDTFAMHKSLAVQQTLYAMGEAAIAIEPAISGLSLKMPNKHRVPFNFKPFGLEFANDIYVTTDEPSGEIAAYISRVKS